MPEPSLADHGVHLIVLTEEQCRLTIRAMGHYCPESDEEAVTLDYVIGRLAKHTDRG